YLPFRRISLPSLHPSQSIQHSPIRRQTTQPQPQPQRSSIASFESFPTIEERERRESVSMAKNNLGIAALPLDDPLLMKRRKVMIEFYETEKTYVEGLNLIHEHFLLPILKSLETPSPILERSLLTAVFSNFIDIWNFHRSFLNELTRLFNESEQLPTAPSFPSPPPPLSPVLLAHFPYLSLYTPFIAAFSQTLAALNTLLTPSHYYRQQPHFVATQEKHPRCGKLQLRDWLLTVVQRCPRYLLLLRDLLNCTPGSAQEREKLIQVYGLVSKITNSLNTSIWSHSQTLSLLALQRSTPNLPLDEFQFIHPGRTLLKRGTLLQIENPDARVRRGESKDGDMRPREREFLLFSDCLVWLASEEAERKEKEWNLDLGSIWSSVLSGNGHAPASAIPRNLKRPSMVRTRSKSEAEVTVLHAKAAVASTSQASLPPSDSQSPTVHKNGRRPTHKSNFSRINKNSALHLHLRGRKDSTSSPRSAGHGEAAHGQWVYKGRIELVNMEIVVDTSFGVDDDLDESSNDPFDEIKWRWEVLSPEGSFVLYASSGKEREEWTSLTRQAISQQLISLNAKHPNSTLTSSEATKHIRRTLQALPFAPNDIRMQETIFTQRLKWYKERRSKVEHWVPAIWIPDEKAEGCMRCGRVFGWRRRRHHCRLCGRCVCSSCSEKTFYITDPNSTNRAVSKAARACNACYESVFPLINSPPDLEEQADDTSGLTQASNADTITSLSNLPSWMNMTVPSLALSSSSSNLVGARNKSKSKELLGPEALMAIDNIIQPSQSGSRIKLRSQSSSGSRPRSYYDIVEDFHSAEECSALSSSSVNSSRRHTTINLSTSSSSISLSASPPTSSSALDVKGKRRLLIAERREDTARRHKRFSTPAVAIQTTSVLGSLLPGMPGTRSKRFSLISGGPASPGSRRVARSEFNPNRDGTDLGKGMAASRLNELLGRSRHNVKPAGG
ncbi:hypothetical protein EV360DRAFT_40334, partial [Lentinula raphanica]